MYSASEVLRWVVGKQRVHVEFVVKGDQEIFFTEYDREHARGEVHSNERSLRSVGKIIQNGRAVISVI